MSRIFISLSVLPVALILITMSVGWWVGDYNQVFSEVTARTHDPSLTEAERDADFTRIEKSEKRFDVHFKLGLATALTTVMINCLSVTYLIGTSRWIKEVCETYALDGKYVAESTTLKRQTFPWSIAGVFSIIMIVAFGAAADPLTFGEATAEWVTPHLFAALLGTCVILWSIFVQGSNLGQNAEIINQVVDEVHRERTARGLPVE